MRRMILPMTLILSTTLAMAAGGSVDTASSQAPGGQTPAIAQVSTDRLSYAVGDTVTVTIANPGPATIMSRGGRVCDSLWPIRLELLGPDGWQAVPVPQDPICGGVSAAQYLPGSSFHTGFVAGPAEGTYRVVYAFDIPGGDIGSLAPAYSAPFTVGSPGASKSEQDRVGVDTATSQQPGGQTATSQQPGGQTASSQAPGRQTPAVVQVSADQPIYAVGDTVTVTIANPGPATIMSRGGLVCDSLWPIRLELLGPDGWQPVPVPQDLPICAGVSAAQYPAGSSFNTGFVAGPAEGTYRVVYAFDIPGGDIGTLLPAYSDPFTVGSPDAGESQDDS